MIGPQRIRVRWRKYRSLAPSERSLLLRATGLLPLAAAGLRLHGLAGVQKAAARFTAGTPRDRPDSQAVVGAARAAAIVDLAARRSFVRFNCLERSLVLWFLLKRQGTGTELRVGVRRASLTGQARFHAWVEHEGVVINDDPRISERYQPFQLTLMPDRARFD